MSTHPLAQAGAEPLRFVPSFEVPQEDEPKIIAELIESLRKIGETVQEDEGHAFRPVHAKTHGLLLAEVEILAGLPEAYAQGAFATPRRLPAVLRFSTTPGDLLSDKVSTPRGLAIKLIGVEGSRVPGAPDDVTQDFVMVNGPVFSSPDAKRFVGNLKLLAATTDRMPRTKNVLSAALRGLESLVEKTGKQSATLKSLGGHPATNILGETFFTQVPLLYGPFMAKVSIAPVSPGLLALHDQHVDIGSDPDAIRHAVVEHFRTQGGTWEIRVQLCTDLGAMPIEDASVEWPQDLSPYVPVARITAQPQTAWSAARSAAVDDGMSFDAWHCLAAHRPLGSIMRVRRQVYREAVARRARASGIAIVEPRSLTSLP